MFIQTEQTPNPATLKFIPGEPVMPSGTMEFPSVEAAAQSPLAARLFEIKGVVRVFYGADFITITKSDDREWVLMKPVLLGTIMNHFTSNQPLLTPEAVVKVADAVDDADPALVKQIMELLDKRVRPAVAQDGGDIQYQSFRDGILYVSMRGACSGCPSSTATLKNGIERLMKHYVPEVLEVRAA